MKRIRIFSTAVLCLTLLVGVAPATIAQDDDIVLVPIEEPLFGIASVVPEGWQSAGSGIYTRGTLPQDLAAVIFQAAPVTTEVALRSLLPRLGLDEMPESTGAFSTDGFEWTLFRIPVDVPGLRVEVELAFAEVDGSVHLMQFQAAPDEFDRLRELVFVPGLEAFRRLEADPTPPPDSLGYVAEEVEFSGGDDGVTLAGTLTLPREPGPHPAIVLMNGSGAQDRDSSFPGVTTLKPFASIADALSSAGVAVLRYDDRGIGGSVGDYSAATVSELAEDGRAAIDLLESRDDIDAGRIGVLGHSEGGIYSAILAADDPRVAFVVALAPPAVPGVDLIIAQNEAVVRASGASEEVVDLTIAFATDAIPAARVGDAEFVEAIVRDRFGQLWDLLDPETQALLGDRDTYVQRQVDVQLPLLLSDWYRSLLAYDPDPDWRRVTVPVLGIFGGKDVQVPAEQNEPALRASLAAAGNEDFKTVVLADANHLFQAADTGAVTEYPSLAGEFTAELLPAIVDWVRLRAGVDG